MSFGLLIINETKLTIYELKQYWFETVSSTIMLCGVFAGLFYGIKSFGDTTEATSLDGLVFGYLLWVFALSAYGGVTKSIIEDNQKGFLEQLFLCPSGYVKLMLARALVEILWSIFFVTLMAVLTMAITDNWLDMNFVTFFALLFVAAPSLAGLGFIISGLTLNFKRVGTVAALFNIGFMGMVAIDALPFNIFTLLPFTAGASLARDVVLNGEAINLVHLAIVAANSAVYLAIGIFFYSLLEKRAKRLNLLGQY